MRTIRCTALVSRRLACRGAHRAIATPRMHGWTAAAAAACSAALAGAAIIHVPSDQPSIGAAIAAASSGDEIVVADGTFAGPANRGLDLLGKALVVRSANGPAACVIDCGQIDRAFIVKSGEPATTTIEGFTIRNGRAPGTDGKGGAVLVDGSTVATGAAILGCIVEDSVALGGGGAVAVAGAASALVTNCTFEGCSAFLGGGGGGGGGAIEASGAAAALEVRECVFIENNAVAGGAIQVLETSGAAVRDCVFVKNVAATFGGAVAAQLSDGIDLWSCRFHGNASQAGGAVVASDSTAVSVAGCEFSGNLSASLSGGAILLVSSAAEVLNCSFSGNTSFLPGGAGAIGRTSSVPSTIRNCIAWGNSSPQIVGFGGDPTAVSHSIVQGGFAGVGNLDADPLLAGVAGVDGMVGTIDDDLSVQSGSPAIDSGSNPAWNIALLADVDGNPRFVDDPGVVDSGEGTAPIIDRGASEVQAAPGCVLGDIDCDGDVDGGDLGLLLGGWGSPDPAADLDSDGVVNGADLGVLLGAWTG